MRQIFPAALLSRLPTRLRALFAERFDKSPIADRDQLCRFVRTRAAYIAQESLYGYLKTRMGTQFPQYFQDEEFSRGIRQASLQLFVSCLADLTVFAVATLSRQAGAGAEASIALAQQCFRRALHDGFAAAGAAPPPDAEAGFAVRLAATGWDEAAEGEAAFAASAEDLVRFAPVIDEFKQLDRHIVVNSIRFRWRDVRHQFRRRAAGAAFFPPAEPDSS